MKKILTLAVAGGAYVLGTKAGRERYAQIAQQAQKLWRDPRVQKQASQASGLVQRKANEATGGRDDNDRSADAGGSGSGTSGPQGSGAAKSGLGTTSGSDTSGSNQPGVAKSGLGTTGSGSS